MTSDPRHLLRKGLVGFLGAFALVANARAQSPLGTAFSYQGQLQNGGNPQNGPCDLRFKLFDASSGGSQVGSTQTLSGVAISNGLFTVSLDFGASAFAGSARWLESAVACPSGGSFTTLAPRQALTPAPNALFAEHASVSTNASLTGDGSGVPLGVAVPLSLAQGAGSFTMYVLNTGSGHAVEAVSTGSAALYGQDTGVGSGVYGTTQGTSGQAGAAGVWGDSGSYYGVWGTSSTADGVHGDSNGAVGVGSGVSGVNSGSGAGTFGWSVSGDGVYGRGDGANGVNGYSQFNTGVRGSSSTGRGLYGSSSTYEAIRGETNSNGFAAVVGVNYAGGAGVYGGANANFGVVGYAAATGGAGVYGYTDATDADGVYGSSTGPNGSSFAVAGVHAVGTNTCKLFCSAGPWSLYAEGTANFVDSVRIGTDLYVFGSKNFVAPHPTDPSKVISYICLEGPEAGTYFRGTARIVGGFAEIEVPESFRLVTAEKGLTAIATPFGSLAMVVCIQKSLEKIVFQGSADVEFDYVVNGVRAGYEAHEAILPNQVFVPLRASDERLAKLPAEAVRRLKSNGILNEDGTVNEETARRMGWDQRADWKAPERHPGQ